MKKSKMKKINTQEIISKISNKIDLEQLQTKFTQYITKITPDRNKLIITVSVILIILFLDFFFVLRSQMHSIVAIKPNIIRLKRDVDNINADLARMQKQRESLDEREVKEIISSSQKDWVNEEIFRLSNMQKVKISQIKSVRREKSSQEPLYTGKYSHILIDMDVSAGYHQLARFLSELENHSVLLGVEELDIKRSEENQFEHSVELRLKTYVSDAK